MSPEAALTLCQCQLHILLCKCPLYIKQKSAWGPLYNSLVWSFRPGLCQTALLSPSSFPTQTPRFPCIQCTPPSKWASGCATHQLCPNRTAMSCLLFCIWHVLCIRLVFDSGSKQSVLMSLQFVLQVNVLMVSNAMLRTVMQLLQQALQHLLASVSLP